MTTEPSDHDLAAAVETGVLQFAESFLRAQDDREGEAQQMDALVPSGLSAPQAIAAAFAVARAQGWLVDLCARCLADRIVSRRFAALAAAAGAGPGSIAAQAWVNDENPFYDTLLQANGLLQAADFVCRIEVDGAHRGTGFLVRPDIVLTAGHVITPPEGGPPLIGPGGATEPDAGARIEVLFSDRIELIAGRRRRSRPVVVGLAPDWLIAREAPGAGAPGPEPDYALIRLERAPLLQPDGLALAADDPYPNDPLLIIQHPKAKPLCHAFGDIDRYDKATTSFTHTTNTEPGSSGAPCLSTDFRVLGIHGGEVRGADPPRNAAFAVTRVAEVLARIPPALAPARYLDQFRLAGGQDRLVVGRHETQDWVRAALAGGGGARILAVSPPQAGARGCGMSFTADLLEALLPPDRHRVVRLSADQFSTDDPVAFARRLCMGAGAPAGLDLPAGPAGDTTLEGWLRREFTGAVLAQLDQLRGGRIIWLVLDDLLRATLAEGTGLREFLDLIYEGAAERPWLRILLLGYETAPPPGAAAVLERVVLPAITPQMIRDRFEERLAAMTDADLVARIRAAFLPLWQYLASIAPDKQLSFAADAASPFVKDLG